MTAEVGCPRSGRYPDAALRMLGANAVTVDLDDTLYDQSSWLEGAWLTVAHVAANSLGTSTAAAFRRLQDAAALGSARGGIIDAAFPEADAAQIASLVGAFRRFRAARLTAYPGAVAALCRLRATGRPLGLITDGDPGGQHNKIHALGIGSLFDAITVSDEAGRQYRKPHPRPFHDTADALHVEPSGVVHIGDRWEKDVIGALGAGCLGVIRVHTGEYRSRPCDVETGDAGLPDDRIACVPDAAAAVDLITTVGLAGPVVAAARRPR